MNEHNGTHVDAPAHFISDAKPGAHVTIENVLLNRLMGRAVRLDCREFREGDYVSSSFVAEWEAVHGSLEAGDIVQLRLVGLLGAASQLWTLRGRLAFGVGIEAAEYLLGKSIAALGVDTLSPDPLQAVRTNSLHPIVLEKQVLIIENLCNLDQLPDFFLFLALPLKIRGGSGSPIRAVGIAI